MTTPSSQTFTSVVTDDSWMRGLRPGHLVELVVYGQTMIGKVQRLAGDNITVRIPIEEQSADLRRFSVTGTAVISIDGAAARVPVSVQSTGEYVRMHFIGPAEIIQRRMHVRVPFQVPVHVAWQPELGGPWAIAKSSSIDISVGGIRVASARTVWPSLGEQVQVSLDLPEGSVVERASVIGKTPAYDLRLAFNAVSPVTRGVIESLMR